MILLKVACEGGFEEEHEQVWEDALCKGQGEQQLRQEGERKGWEKQESGASGGAQLLLLSTLR